MNTYTEPEFLAVAETLGYHRVNRSSRMGGTALAATDGGVVFVRDWEKCSTPDDVERLLACYHSLERKNHAAAALGRLGRAAHTPAQQAASRANGAKGGRPQTDLSRAVDETIAILDKAHPDRAAWLGQFRAVTRHGLTVADRAARLADILAGLGWQNDPRFGALYDALNREPEE